MRIGPKKLETRGARDAAWRLAFLYAALFLVVGFYLPYFPVWLYWRGLKPDEIALLIATPLFARILFTPLISFAADRVGDRRVILIALACGSLLSFLLLWASAGFWQMFLATLLVAVNWTAIMPLTETVAMTGVRAGALDYGRVRLWGSLSFIAASLGAGLVIGAFGAWTVLPLLVAAAALLTLGTYLLPRTLTARSHAAPSVFRRLSLADAFALARSRLFLLFLAGASLIQASHALLYSFGTLHWQAQGFPASAIGGLWSVGVVAEIGLFAFAGRIVTRLGASRLLLLAGLAATARWGFMAADPPLLATSLLQILHALSFGAAHIAAMHFLTEGVPEDRAATAQGIYASVVAGLVMGVATIASGPLYRTLAGEAYGVMAALALIGAVCAFLLMRRWRSGLVVVVDEPQPQSSDGAGKTVPAS